MEAENLLRNVLEISLFFANLSGLTINYQKSVVIWLGSKKNNDERFLRDKNFTWDPGGPDNTRFKYLGIWFSTNIELITQINLENKLTEISKICNIWKKRSLTPYGKITVLKTLALSKLTYIFMNLPDPNQDFLKRLDSIFYQFLWDGKPGKIAKDHMNMSKENGGFNMINVFDYVSCLKIGLFKKMLLDEEMKTLLLKMYPMLQNICTLGYVFFDKLIDNIPNQFWCDICKHVKRLLIKKTPDNYDDIVSEFIFYNKNILVNNEIVFYRNWLQNDIFQIQHLLNNDGTFMNYNAFRGKYPNVRSNFLQYQGLVNSIKNYIAGQNVSEKDINDVQEPIGWRTLRGSKKDIREELKKQPNKHISMIKWDNQFGTLNWNRIFMKCYKTTIDVKLRWFQMRLLYRVLPTNRLLHIKRIKDNDMCNFCQTTIQTIPHLFWDCPHVVIFWRNLNDTFIHKLPHAQNLQLSKDLVLFGYKDNVYMDKPMDLFILLAKYHIYSCKMSNNFPSGHVFLKLFKYRYKLEKLNMYNPDNNYDKFNLDWMPYTSILEQV